MMKKVIVVWSLLNIISFSLSSNILDDRSVGPPCLDSLLSWKGKPNKINNQSTGIGSFIDKIYIIHYSKATDRKVKMIDTLLSIGVNENSSIVDFVEDFDREELPHELGKCVNCGETNISPAVCSVNLKHIAAYHDIVKQGHGLSLIIEDDIDLSGPEAVTDVIINNNIYRGIHTNIQTLTYYPIFAQ